MQLDYELDEGHAGERQHSYLDWRRWGQNPHCRKQDYDAKDKPERFFQNVEKRSTDLKDEKKCYKMKDKNPKFQLIRIQTNPEENETEAITKCIIKESRKMLEQKGSLIQKISEEKVNTSWNFDISRIRINPISI